jgi:hypothetical protein
VTSGRSTTEIDLWQVPWPIPLADGFHQILLVLRGWIEGKPDPHLAEILERLPNWQGALDRFRAALPRGGVELDGFSVVDEEVYRLGLLEAGLLATPSTVRYCSYRVAPELFVGRPPPWPTRGVELLSFGLAPLGTDVDASPGGMVHQMSWDGFWHDERICLEACRAARRRARWWQSLGQVPIPRTDLAQFNRRPAGEFRALCEQFRDETITAEALVRAAFRQDGASNDEQRARVLRSLVAQLKRLGPDVYGRYQKNRLINRRES